MQPLRRVLPARPYLLGTIEALLIAAAYLAAVMVFYRSEASLYLEYEGGVIRIATVVAAFVIANYFFGTYEEGISRVPLVIGLHVMAVVGATLLFQAAIGFLSPELILSEHVVLLGTGLTILLLTAWRTYIRPHVWNAFGAQQVVFLGVNDAALRLVDTFQNQPGLGYQAAALLSDQNVTIPFGIPRASEHDLTSFVGRIKPDRVIVSETVRDRDVLQVLLRLKTSGLSIETIGQVYEKLFGRVYTLGLEPYSLIFRSELSARPHSLALQAIYANLLALAGFVLLFPLLILIGLLVRLSGAPHIFEKKVCSGLHGIPFHRFTFRCEGRLGRFLTRFHLAGLPQAINLVRGEMTLIGPRPERVEFVSEMSELIPFYTYKSSVKPGLIGWSQVHAMSDECQDTLEALEYDLYYIKQMSVVLDAYIFLRALRNFFANKPNTISARRPEHVSIS